MKQIQYEGAVLEVELYAARQSNKEYDVFLREGEWPNDRDLIILTDGGKPSMRLDELLFKHGLVDEGEQESHKIVTIYS